ncbi:MAG TPA: hypothetical protein VEZ12_22445, partial [Herpetosiphonaceae bacterium]|nr:hypothetical protein [Herpetosiphonaceae bacterium]
MTLDGRVETDRLWGWSAPRMQRCPVGTLESLAFAATALDLIIIGECSFDPRGEEVVLARLAMPADRSLPMPGQGYSKVADFGSPHAHLLCCA